MIDFNEVVTTASDNSHNKEKIYLFLMENPQAGPGTIARHLGISVNTVTKTLKPNGFPDDWTKEFVENVLNGIVWKNAKGVTFEDLKRLQSVPNTPLWRAFVFYGFPASYPLENYRRKFHKMIYALFGMDIPRSYEEERETEWPPQKILHKRYLSLMRQHHPDHHNQNDMRAKVATINCQLIADAYQKLLKRKKWIAMGAPPPIRKKEAAIHSKKKLD